MSGLGHSVADSDDSSPWHIPVNLLDRCEEVALEISSVDSWWVNPKGDETDHSNEITHYIPWYSSSETSDTSIRSELMNALLRNGDHEIEEAHGQGTGEYWQH